MVVYKTTSCIFHVLAWCAATQLSGNLQARQEPHTHPHTHTRGAPHIGGM